MLKHLSEVIHLGKDPIAWNGRSVFPLHWRWLGWVGRQDLANSELSHVFLKVAVEVCFSQQIGTDYVLLIYVPPDMLEVICPCLLELTGECVGDDTGQRHLLAVWVLICLLTTPFAVIKAARACITPCLKIETEKVKCRKNCRKTQNYLHIYIGVALFNH